jgi:SAM-dependent methyltransferase
VAEVEPKEVVRIGYDRASDAYRRDDDPEAEAAYAGFLEEILRLVPGGSRVLDLGCGAGVPASHLLAPRFRVLGVDISAVQVERARLLVPAAEFRQADMTALDLPAGSFAAIVCLYAVIHVPLEEQPALFVRMAGWLRPGGYLLVTVGHQAWTGTEDDWLGSGATMAWSHADERTYLEWLARAGVRVLRRTFVPEGADGHVLLLAQKAERGASSSSIRSTSHARTQRQTPAPSRGAKSSKRRRR